MTTGYFPIFASLFFVILFSLPVLVWFWRKFNFKRKLRSMNVRDEEIAEHLFGSYLVLLIVFAFTIFSPFISDFQDIMSRIKDRFPLLYGSPDLWGLTIFYVLIIFVTFFGILLGVNVMEYYKTNE